AWPGNPQKSLTRFASTGFVRWECLLDSQDSLPLLMAMQTYFFREQAVLEDKQDARQWQRMGGLRHRASAFYSAGPQARANRHNHSLLGVLRGGAAAGEHRRSARKWRKLSSSIRINLKSSWGR